jgi:hypothetical protein
MNSITRGTRKFDTIGTIDRKRFFKALVTKNFSEAGTLIGLDKKYTNASSLRATSYQLYQDILANDLDKLGIDKEVVEIVTSAIEARKSSPGREITEVNNADLLVPEDTKGVIIGGRNKAAMLLHKKMDRLSKNKKLLDATTLTQLATTFGILFDKAQILTGQATENIAMMSKVSLNGLTPEETLELLINNREKQQIDT